MPPLQRPSIRSGKRWRRAATIMLTLLVIFLGLRWFEHRQTYQPSGRMVSSATDAHPETREINFVSGGKWELSAWLIPCLEEAAYGDWLIILSHGNAGNISHRQDLYQTWQQLGFNLLAYDYRGYGQSAGKPSEKGSYQDLEAAIDWAVSHGYERRKILLLGKSLGGGVACELAGHDAVAGLILHSTFTSIPDLGAELFPILPVRLVGSIRYDTRSKLAEVNVPVLILHSREDSLIGYHHAATNFDAAKDPKWLHAIPGDHNDPEWVRLEPLRSIIPTFMEKVMDAANSPDAGAQP